MKTVHDPRFTIPAPAARFILAILALPLLSYGWQASAPPATTCLAVGQMSGWDIEEGTIALKSDSGHYSDVRYDRSTVFTDNNNKVLPSLDLNLDDRICVQSFSEHAAGMASRVLIVRRSQVNARDKADLLEWERDSAFGTVKSLDPDNRSIVLRTPGGSEIVVDAAGPTAFWSLPADAIEPADAVPGVLKDLAAGSTLYVRGDRASGTGSLRARLIVSGGFRSFVGSIASMDALNESLGLRDFRSGRVRNIHFDFSPIYVVASSNKEAERHLYAATIGDLDEGDSVLVFARQDAETGKIDGYVLITGFSLDTIVSPPRGRPSDWIFKSIGFGGPGLGQ